MNEKRVTLPQQILRKAVSKVGAKGFTYIDLYKKAGWHSSDWNAHWNGNTKFMTSDMEGKIEIAVKSLTKVKS